MNNKIREVPSPLANDGYNYGIAVMRIISMLAIVFLHLFAESSLYPDTVISSPSSYKMLLVLLRFFFVLSFVGIDCFAMITGYVSVYSKKAGGRALYLWLEVFFYSVIVILIRKYALHEDVTGNDILFAFLPFSTKRYWYFTAYLPLLFLTPYINKFINCLSKKEFRLLLLIVFIFFSFINAVAVHSFDENESVLAYGETFTWLLIMYFFGAYVRLYPEDFKRNIFVYLAVYLVFVLLSYRIHTFKYFYDTDSHFPPNIVIAAFSLLIFFSKLKIYGKTNRRFLKFSGNIVFAVYLIHWSLLVTIAKYISAFSPKRAVLLIIPLALLIMSSCMAVDCLRYLLFKVCHVNKACAKMDEFAAKLTNRLS